MLCRPIPSTGQMLPAIGLGTWRGFDIGSGKAERARRAEVLRVLFAHGGRVIDSSPMYGRAEAVTGDLLTELGLHDQAFVATKVGPRAARPASTRCRPRFGCSSASASS